jgi:multiple sugar transport system permease protein
MQPGKSFDVVSSMKKLLFYFVIFSVFALITFPVFWGILCSFKTFQEIFSVPIKFIPSKLTLLHYENAWFRSNIPIYFVNSLLVAVGTGVVTVCVASLAAYSLTRFPFPGINVIARAVLFCYLLPPVLLSIPFFVMLNWTHLLNSRIGLVFGHTALSLPFVIWLFWGFFRTIPLVVEEAAKIDGASRMRILSDIFLPLALPGIVAGFIFSFIVSWSDFLISSVIVTAEKYKTIPLGVNALVAVSHTSWELILPALGIATLPILIVMIALQKYLLEGFSAPIIKG